MLGRLYRASVWAPDAIPEGEKAYRLIPQLILPMYDVVTIAFALVGLVTTIPALDKVYDPLFVDGLALLLAFTALCALVGVAFPRLQALELAAKFGLIVLLTTYPGAMLALALEGVGSREAIAILLFNVLGLPIFRVLFLMAKMWTEQQKRRIVRHLRG